MLVTSILVLVGMPTLGLILQAVVPEGAVQSVIKEWGAAGAMLLICLAFCWHLLKRNEALQNKLFEVIEENTKALTTVATIIGNCEAANDQDRPRRRNHGD